MTIGVVIYVLSGHRLAQVGHTPSEERPRPWGKLGLVLLGAGGLFALSRLSDTNPKFEWLTYGYVILPLCAIVWFGIQQKPDTKRMAAVLVFSLAALIFWAIFEQAGSTIALFSDQLTDRTLPNDGMFNLLGWKFRLGSPFPSAWFQSINSLFVILLAPFFAWLWVRLGDRQPSAPFKFVMGLTFLGLSFLLMVPAAKLTVTHKVSPLWIVALFFLQTVGELCLSPVGLSTMTKLAPVNLVGLVMGIWFLAAAFGNKLAGVVAGEFTSTDGNKLAQFFLSQTLWVVIATVALLASVRWLKRLMGNVR